MVGRGIKSIVQKNKDLSSMYNWIFSSSSDCDLRYILSNNIEILIKLKSTLRVLSQIM